MLFRTHRPAPPLDDFIEDFWSYEHYASPSARERILPSGTFELVFNLREDELRIYADLHSSSHRRYSGAVVSGPYAGYFVSDAHEEVSIMGAHFKPGGAFPFFGVPAGEFTNRHVNLADLWPSQAKELRERLVLAATASQRFDLLRRALLRHLHPAFQRRAEVSAALGMLAQPMIGSAGSRTRDVARRVELSERRFIELFRHEVGVTPKLYSRIQRFHRALQVERETPRPAWAEHSLACGYFDQSHLIRDFQEFSGLGPAEYVRWLAALRDAGAHRKRNHLPAAR